MVGPIEEAQLGLSDGTDEASNDGTGLYSDGHGLRAISDDYHRSVNAHPERRYRKNGSHNHPSENSWYEWRQGCKHILNPFTLLLSELADTDLSREA